MKKIYLALIVLVGISVSCTKNFEDWQKDEKHPSEVPGEMLFTNAQKALADQVVETNVNVNNWKLFSQYWTEVTYTNEANYDIISRTVADGVFRVIYRDVLMDLKRAKTLIDATPIVTGTDEQIAARTIAKANKLLIIDLLEVYSYQRLVDIFGNVPYTQALDIDATLNPAYDDGFTIYKDLLSRLDNIIANFKDGSSYGSADIYFAGDVAAWKTFAYSLKARLAITIADVDDAFARAAFEAAIPNTFASSNDNVTLVYLQNPVANTNPLWQALVNSGRHDFVAANTIVDIMNNLEDPRRTAYFQPIADGSYLGGQYGYPSSYGTYSHVGEIFHTPTYPSTLMSYTEILFYKAEAAARGWAVDGSAVENYEAAITSSFADWGVDGAADYIASEGVAWDGTSDWKKAIGTQAWLAFYERGFEGWTTYRRLDWPMMNVPEAPETTDGEVPRRFTFPVNEQTLNATSYAEAASAIGGDAMETKLFWDKH
ncbi:MAG: SusD/RagB family nutrient-binding outer membrane lipoprotein [Bacteroidales bacterium]|nr:SusD/RagB family nutrient-binding outer membrane lipoprotein [Bacteroidales bacterium]